MSKISFTSDGKWEGGGNIHPELRDLSDLYKWIKNFLTVFVDLKKKYDKYTLKDGSLIGQEKANIIFALEEIIGGLLLFRQYIDKDNKSELKSHTNSLPFIFILKIILPNWRGKGKLPYQTNYNLNSFANWHNDILLKDVQTMFTKYTKAMSDGVLDYKEREDLIIFVETFLSNLLQAEREIAFSDLDN
ncbi:MAG: hypothetical protein KAH95_13345 [Spirochaetales bacterium]|nr:hypothetical protein [Spirochaetales bacterium]